MFYIKIFDVWGLFELKGLYVFKVPITCGDGKSIRSSLCF